MPPVLKQKLKLIAIAGLKPHPKNARKHASALLDESIAENGVYKPVIVSEASGYILAGHGLVERAAAAGIGELWVILLANLTLAQELKIIAADNRSSDEAGYDDVALAELLTSIVSEAGTLEGTGYDQAKLDSLVNDAANAILADAKQRAATLRGKSDATASEDAEAPGDQSDELCSRFCVMITCQNELHQTELLERLTTEGLECRALIS